MEVGNLSESCIKEERERERERQKDGTLLMAQYSFNACLPPT